MAGTLFLVVGPSGAGKDTLIAGARRRLFGDPDFVFPRRVTTRPADAGGEDHEEISPQGFEERRRNDGFLLHWNAHGLRYGIPGRCARDLEAGRHVVANVSRTVVAEAASGRAPVVVVEVVAPPEVLRARLVARGRETGGAIGRRLARDPGAPPASVERRVIENTASVEEGVDRLVAVLRSASASSSLLLRRKIGGSELDRGQYRRVLADIVDGRFGEREVADFLVAITETLTRDETAALARARSEFMFRLDWGSGTVADKHSLGGIPGNRISMIVVPIVAAHGLTIPKTSSRAITSPAGTADTMEVLARGDLDADETREVVRRTNGCLVSNARLRHSRIDGLMNDMTRPLRLDSLGWSVASILAQKLAAGATHCVIDVPVGPAAKVRTGDAAAGLRELFLHVGEALGLELDVRLTDGSRPVGRGVGPALEARDVVAVLRNRADAPADLRDKALAFSAAALAFDPSVDGGNALSIARGLLSSGAAWETFERMAAAQGRPPETVPEPSHAAEVAAGADGVVAGIDCFGIAGIARDAGAPTDKSAGLDLLARVGDRVERGTPLYRIQARSGDRLEAAVARARESHGFSIRAG